MAYVSRSSRHHYCQVADTIKMRWFLSLLFLGLLAAVNALSSSGNRLLVIIDDLGEAEKYSKFLGDLEGLSAAEKSFQLLHTWVPLAWLILIVTHSRSWVQNYC